MRLDANDARPATFRRIGRNANYRNSLVLGIVDKWLQCFRISSRQDNSLYAASHKLLECVGVPFSEHFHGSIHKLDSKMGNLPGLFQNAAPQLIVEKMNFSRYAHADFCAGLGDGQCAGGEIWRVADLT